MNRRTDSTTLDHTLSRRTLLGGLLGGILIGIKKLRARYDLEPVSDSEALKIT